MCEVGEEVEGNCLMAIWWLFRGSQGVEGEDVEAEATVRGSLSCCGGFVC